MNTSSNLDIILVCMERDWDLITNREFERGDLVKAMMFDTFGNTHAYTEDFSRLQMRCWRRAEGLEIELFDLGNDKIRNIDV